MCVSCAHTGIHFSKEHKQHLSMSKMGENNPAKRPEVRKKLSIKSTGKNNPMKRPEVRKKFCGENSPTKRPEVRQKLREAQLRQGCPNFNPSACKIIDKYGKDFGYHFQHALNGGEIQVIGYSLDGYDAKNNVVIEYYEKRHHSKPEERLRDKERKRRIKNHLNCKFIELRENNS
jgi:hypothetical protein